MPELPEVETIRRQLGGVLSGQKVVAVDVRRAKSFGGKKSQMVGKKIKGVGRKGKMVVVDLGDPHLLIHLKMTGQLIYQEKKNTEVDEPHFKDHRVHMKFGGRIIGGHPTASWISKLPDKHTRIVIKLSRGTLYFNDMRVFGWIKVVDEKERDRVLEKMPPDVIDREMDGEGFYKILRVSARAVKLVVMDSTKIGGVGNIYANDGLWKARIDPGRKAKSLGRVESDRLLLALKAVVRLGIKLGGATASDQKFVQTTGLGGKYQEHFLTYEREGEKCKRRSCVGVIRKIKLGGRGTYSCPKCQK